MSVSKVLSIEITDLVTRVCEMSYNTKTPVVYKSIIFNNPEYSVDDGMISDRVAYGAELKSQLTAAGMKCSDVVFVLSSSKVVSRDVTIPEMKEELISQLIDNERGEYFPMDTSGYVFSYYTLERIKAEKKRRILIYGVPELNVKNFTALAAEQDLKIIAIDYVGNAIAQWIGRQKQPQIDIYLQINEKNSIFTIFENGMLALQRNMNFGTSVLANNLIDEGYYGRDLDPETIMVKLKNEVLLYKSFSEMETFSPSDQEEAKLHSLKERLTEATRPFISNISRVLEYYNTKSREAQITKIYVGGIGSRVNGLKELVESEFNGIELEILESLPGANIHKKNLLATERSTEFISCMGVALPTINFYKKQEEKKTEKTLILCIIGLIIVLAAAAVIIYNGKTEYDDAVVKRDIAQTKLEILQKGGIEELEAQAANVNSVVADVAAMDAQTFVFNEYWNDVLANIEEFTVSNAKVYSVTSSDAGLMMNVRVADKRAAAKLIMQLERIPYFESVSTGSIVEEEDPETGISSVVFTVNCVYQVVENEEGGIN